MNPLPQRLPRTFTLPLTLAATGVLLQSVTAGLFVNQDGRDGWVTVHGVIADVTWLAALVAAIVGLRRVRRHHRMLGIGAAVLFVLAVVQTGLGHLITDKGMDGLIAVHVPLAAIILVLAVALLIEIARMRRDAPAATDPYAAEPAPRSARQLSRGR